MGLVPEGSKSQYCYPSIARPIASAKDDPYYFTVGIVHEVHGTLTPGGEAGSLLVFSFLFLSMNPKRRFKHAVMELQFSDLEQPGNAELDPIIDGLEPYGRFDIDPTPRDVSKLVRVGLNGMVPTPFGLFAPQLLTLEKSTTLKVTDKGYLAGAAFAGGRLGNSEEDNTVSFSISENPSQADGIPAQLTAAIALKRKTEKFQMTAKIKVDLGFPHNYIANLPSEFPVTFPHDTCCEYR